MTKTPKAPEAPYVSPFSDEQLRARSAAAWAAKTARAKAEHREQLLAIAEETGNRWTDAEIDADWKQMMARKPPTAYSEKVSKRGKPEKPTGETPAERIVTNGTGQGEGRSH